MSTNKSSKENLDWVSAIKYITNIPARERTEEQVRYLDDCLNALAHQPPSWADGQGWGPGGPMLHLLLCGIEWKPAALAPGVDMYSGSCDCDAPHWRALNFDSHQVAKALSIAATDTEADADTRRFLGKLAAIAWTALYPRMAP